MALSNFAVLQGNELAIPHLSCTIESKKTTQEKDAALFPVHGVSKAVATSSEYIKTPGGTTTVVEAPLVNAMLLKMLVIMPPNKP